jgi:TonB family protein
MRTMLLSTVAGAAVMLAGAANAQTAATLTAAPTAADMAAAYPAKARAEGVGGGVELVCSVKSSGALGDCDVMGESPKGYGFGGAAQKLAKSLRADPSQRGTEVRVPVSFNADVLKPQGMTVKTPKWAALPSVTDLQTTIPKTEGGPNNVRVTLVCTVQAGGSLDGCAVDREEPAGQGFGQAVLALASKFKVEPWSAEGMPTVGAKVRVPVRYDLKPVDQAAR